MNSLAHFCKEWFSPSAPLIREISPQAAKKACEATFYRHGLPQRARFDNGWPFANTKDRSVPTALVLWLVSLGIEVVLNRPYSPQQNGSVECTQRISSRWANPSACANAEQLQQALDQVAQEHLFVLRQRKNGDRTRAEQYPELTRNRRSYDPTDVDLQRVRRYLLQFRWSRKVYDNGRLSIFGCKWVIGTKYRQQKVNIQLHPQQASWMITKDNGQIIKIIKAPNLNKQAITDLTVFSKNFTT